MSLSDNFSRNLLYIREMHNSTLTEFADEISISRSHLQSILQGSCNPTLDTVEQIGKGLQIDPILLLLSPKQVTSTDSSLQLLQNIREMKDHLQVIVQILDEMMPEESEPPEDR